MFIMFCHELLQALAESLKLSLARESLGAEEVGDVGPGGSDLAYYSGCPSVEPIHAGRPAGFVQSGRDCGVATPDSFPRQSAERGSEGERNRRLLFLFFLFSF